MNRNLMSVARKALPKAYNPNSLTITNNLFLAGLSLSLSVAHVLIVLDHLVSTYAMILVPLRTSIFECFQGLSWSVDEKSLKDAFSSFGDVSLKELLLWQTSVI
ncbi:hypothetical protein NC652_007341 [Populus alba x Populus x berolinensis]|nr:hypothetical protein NC652_007341 [Populus alba x Populus x berolinensis]